MLVELVVESLCRRIELDDVAQIDKLGGGAAVIQQRRHVATAQLLALAHNLVLDPARHLLEVLGRLEDLGQALTLCVHILDEGRKHVRILQRVPAGLDVVGADSLDNVVVAAMAGFLGGAGGAEEPVGGALELGVVAAGRADNGGALVLVAGPAVLSAVCGRTWGECAMCNVHHSRNNVRYVGRKLAHARSPKLEHHPSARQMLLLGVARYPLREVLVSICNNRHVCGACLLFQWAIFRQWFVSKRQQRRLVLAVAQCRNVLLCCVALCRVVSCPLSWVSDFATEAHRRQWGPSESNAPKPSAPGNRRLTHSSCRAPVPAHSSVHENTHVNPSTTTAQLSCCLLHLRCTTIASTRGVTRCPKLSN